MQGVEVAGCYNGMKLHFTKTYDYTKYGPSRVSAESLGKQYVVANALGGKFNRDSLEYRLLSIFKRKDIWLNEVDRPESQRMEIEHREQVEGFYDLFPSNLERILQECGTIKDALKCPSAFEVPPIGRMALKGEVSVECYVALDLLTGFSPKIPELVWGKEGHRFNRYKFFFKPDLKTAASILKRYI